MITQAPIDFTLIFALVQWIIVLALGAFAIIMAISILVTRDQGHAIAFLALLFVDIAVFFLILGAEYLAIIQVTIYAGGIVVLFIFALHLTREEEFLVRGNFSIPFGIVIAFGVFVMTALAALATFGITNVEMASLAYTLGDFGTFVFINHPISFFFIGMALLATMVGSIYLVTSKRKEASSESSVEEASNPVATTSEVTE